MADHDDWVASARGNLGLSGAATKNVGTTAGTVAAGDRGIPDPTSVPDGRVLTTDTGVAVWQAPSGGGGTLAAGYWVNTVGVASGYNTVGDGNMGLYPYVVRFDMWVDALGCRTTTAGVGSVMRMGIYATADGISGSLLVESSPVALDSAGDKVASVSPTFLKAGVYLIAGVRQGASTPTVAIISGSTWVDTATGIYRQPRPATNFDWGGSLIYGGSVSGSLPATATRLSSAASVPIVWLGTATAP